MAARDEIHIKPTHLAALLVAMFGGNMLVTANWTNQEVVRPDPFTGTQGAVLAQQIKNLEEQVDSLQKHGPDGVQKEIEYLRQRLDNCIELIDSKQRSN